MEITLYSVNVYKYEFVEDVFKLIKIGFKGNILNCCAYPVCFGKETKYAIKIGCIIEKYPYNGKIEIGGYEFYTTDEWTLY